MYTHRIVADLPIHGRCVLILEYCRRRLPSSGTEYAYSPTLRRYIEFELSEILESQVSDYELV